MAIGISVGNAESRNVDQQRRAVQKWAALFSFVSKDYINHIHDDLHSRLTVIARKKRARKIAAFLGMMGVFSVIAWLFLQVLPSDRLGLKYISVEVIDIQTIDDGKGDKRNIFVRYEGGQMMFQTDDLDFVDDIQGFVCIKEWQGVPVPQGGTPPISSACIAERLFRDESDRVIDT